ncbi:hypothetical protein DEFDS_P243 (plasmid) [Deferribacter desulfuricans SSM1]|uniref:Beta-lactamase n=1 Tax=Deferribacter desulfuricans (strain DSM 14783 / JCM 11476 / NBRC 101012 / SSM1) TaxID=639282 RepID=D3PF71_DEFDS|nr:hypothetical protein [Deferribacter desulfuricans]BAI81863.1 hypothetical protein DEFDS_P243 [Deferribacter desulfuricans SSM1]
MFKYRFYLGFALIAFIVIISPKVYSLNSLDLNLHEQSNIYSTTNKVTDKSDKINSDKINVVKQNNNVKNSDIKNSKIKNKNVNLSWYLIQLKKYDNSYQPEKVIEIVKKLFDNLNILNTDSNIDSVNSIRNYLNSLNFQNKDLFKSILFRYSVALAALNKIDKDILKEYLILSTNDKFTIFPEVAVLLGDITQNKDYYEKYLKVIKTYYKTTNSRKKTSFKNHTNILLYTYYLLQKNYKYKLDSLDKDILKDCVIYYNKDRNYRLTTLKKLFSTEIISTYYQEKLKELNNSSQENSQKKTLTEKDKHEIKNKSKINKIEKNDYIKAKNKLVNKNNMNNSKTTTDEHVLFKEALSVLNSGDYLQAFAKFEDIYNNTGNTKARYYMCVIYYKLKKYHNAVSCFKSLDLKKHPLALWNLAVMYNKGLGVEKNVQKAYEYYNQYLKIKEQLNKNTYIPITQDIKIYLASYLSELLSTLYLFNVSNINTTELNKVVYIGTINNKSIYDTDYLDAKKILFGFNNFNMLSYLEITFKTDYTHLTKSIKHIKNVLEPIYGKPVKYSDKFINYTESDKNISYESIPAILWVKGDYIVVVEVNNIVGNITLKVKNKSNYKDFLELLETKQE